MAPRRRSQRGGCGGGRTGAGARGSGGAVGASSRRICSCRAAGRGPVAAQRVRAHEAAPERFAARVERQSLFADRRGGRIVGLGEAEVGEAGEGLHAQGAQPLTFGDGPLGVGILFEQVAAIEREGGFKFEARSRGGLRGAFKVNHVHGHRRGEVEGVALAPGEDEGGVAPMREVGFEEFAQVAHRRAQVGLGGGRIGVGPQPVAELIFGHEAPACEQKDFEQVARFLAVPVGWRNRRIVPPDFKAAEELGAEGVGHARSVVAESLVGDGVQGGRKARDYRLASQSFVTRGERRRTTVRCANSGRRRWTGYSRLRRQ